MNVFQSGKKMEKIQQKHFCLNRILFQQNLVNQSHHKKSEKSVSKEPIESRNFEFKQVIDNLKNRRAFFFQKIVGTLSQLSTFSFFCDTFNKKIIAKTKQVNEKRIKRSFYQHVGERNRFRFFLSYI